MFIEPSIQTLVGVSYQYATDSVLSGARGLIHREKVKSKHLFCLFQPCQDAYYVFQQCEFKFSWDKFPIKRLTVSITFNKDVVDFLQTSSSLSPTKNSFFLGTRISSVRLTTFEATKAILIGLGGIPSLLPEINLRMGIRPNQVQRDMRGFQWQYLQSRLHPNLPSFSWYLSHVLNTSISISLLSLVFLAWKPAQC